MQTMIDALYPGSILLDSFSKNADLVAAYIDHPDNPDSFQQAASRFPDKELVKISIKCTVGARVLDCEPSTHVTPAQCVPWAVKSRAAGIEPTVYCNQMSTDWGWTNVRQEFAKANVAQPYYWVANYNGSATIPVGAIGHQYNDLDAKGHNSYDASVMTDGWPLFKEDDMGGMTAEEHNFLKDLHDWFDGPILQGTVNKANELAAALDGIRNIFNNLNADLAQDKAQTATLVKVLAQLTALNTAVAQLAQLGGSGTPIPADFWTQVKAVVDDSLSHLQLSAS